MVDPQRCTKFDRTDQELEEFIVFCVCVAGKNAKNTAKAIHKLHIELQGGICNVYKPNGELYETIVCDDPRSLFLQEIDKYVGTWEVEAFARLLKVCGLGCYTRLSNTLSELAYKVCRGQEINLRTCSVQDLEKIPGIGSKTARYFLLHTRPDQRLAVLDVHVLTYLRDSGIISPKTTPSKGSKQYLELEKAFLELADKQGISPAELDLRVWNEYSKNGLK